MTDNKRSSIREVKPKLDKAIDDMDTLEIEKQLMYLSRIEPFPHKIEDSKAFAMDIIAKSKGGKRIMNKRRITLLVAIIAFVMTLGTIAFGSGLLKFNFYNEDTTVQIRTDENISDKQAEEMAREAAEDYGKDIDDDAVVVDNDYEEYSGLKEAQEAIGTQLIIPSFIPDEFSMDENIMVQNGPLGDKNVYITYTSEDEKFLGITVLINGDQEGTSVMVTDAVYKDKYKTLDGVEYTLLDEDGGKIAMIDRGDFQYALVFMGVEDDTIKKVIDSVKF